jgi:hypothetical protein
MTLRRINIDMVSPRIPYGREIKPTRRDLKTTQIIVIASRDACIAGEFTNGTRVAIETREIRHLSQALDEQGEPHEHDVQ